ncbi:MAG: QueT transporter family protein [Firmicutes bacterium]|nr:QueT transporter family protein [Bacillota bacterium]
MKQTTFNAKIMALGAIIAAMYVALTIVFAPISYGAVQVRISVGTTFLTLLSDAPIISHSSITSQSASPLSRTKRFFSSMLPGTSASKTCASTIQNRLRGCP